MLLFGLVLLCLQGSLCLLELLLKGLLVTRKLESKGGGGGMEGWREGGREGEEEGGRVAEKSKVKWA